MKARVWPRIEPLALIAATLATAMAICYVWLIRQQGSQPLPWVLALLLAGLRNIGSAQQGNGAAPVIQACASG